jgi:hypothetical protein
VNIHVATNRDKDIRILFIMYWRLRALPGRSFNPKKKNKSIVLNRPLIVLPEERH